ncbi:MAG: hypothetical protein LBD64_06800 [Odoribacteraceae bacterium]|jgi:hypothetical protein|nr:hypothetical protein [Odoribacteraceae bacterium]
MKNRNKAWILAILFLAGACVEDSGNYDYIPVDEIFPVEISGLADTTFLLGTTVELHPEVKGLDSDLSKYDFVWYSFPISATGYAPKRDTIGTTIDLSFFVTYQPGESRQLVFEIKEKSSGLAVIKKVKIVVTSAFSNGWFIVNDINDQTDVDFINTNGVIHEDIISLVSGQKLQGKGVKIAFQSSGYYHDKIMPDGTLSRLVNQSVFHVMSENDLKTLNASSLEVYKNWEDEFFSPPAVKKPRDIITNYLGYVYLINDGRLHSIMGMTAGPGKFAYQKIGGEGIYPCILIGDFAQNATVFSNTTSSFLAENMMNLQEVVSGSTGTPAVNMECDVLWMERRVRMYTVTCAAWAITRSKTQPYEYHLLDIDAYGAENPIIDRHLLDPAARVLSADVYGVHPEHSAAFYFAKGNLLSYFQKGDSSGDDEVNLYTFSAGEIISYIGKNPTTSNLEVLTNANNTWKLYIFALANGGQYPYIDGPDPLTVYSGNGNARYLIYR